MTVPHNPAPGQEAQFKPASATALPQSLSRRRTLLAGLGRAGALAGAAVPLSTLATGSKPGMRLNKTGKYYMCTVSGQNSVIHSAQVGTPADCGGKGVAWYCQKNVSGTYTNWPMYGSTPVCTIGSTNYRSTAVFSTAFGCSLSTKSGYTLGTLMDSHQSSEEAHWIVAMLNATKMSSYFPFTTTEVKTMCQEPNATTRANSLTFFSGYLEQG